MRPSRITPRQEARGDAVPRVTPDMAADPFPASSGGGGGDRMALPGSGMPGGPGAAAPGASYALQSPAYFQPPNSTTLRLQGQQAVQVVGDGELVLATTKLGPGTVAALRIVNVGINNLLGTASIVFRIKVAGSAVEGWTWSPFPAPIAVFQQEFPPESTLIEVPETAEISLTAEVLDGGTYDIAMMVQGWRYGRKLRDDFDRAWRAGVV